MISKPVKWMIRIGILFAVLAAGVAIMTGIVLPRYVEGRLLPRLGEEFGLSPGALRVRRIGLWGSDIGPIRLNAPDGPAIAIAAVQVDYTPLSLIRSRIKGLTIGGIGLRITSASDGVSVAGIRMPTKADDAARGKATLDLRTLLPLDIGYINIIQSHVNLEFQERRFVVPFEVKLHTDQLSDGFLKGHANLTFMGNPISLTASLDQGIDLISLEIAAPGFQASALERLSTANFPFQLSGRLDVDCKVSVGLRSFNFKELAFFGRSTDLHIASPYGTLGPVTEKNRQSRPMEVSIAGNTLSEIKWRCTPFRIHGPFGSNVSELSGTMSRTPGRWSLNGDIKTLLPRQAISDRLRLASDLPLDWHFSMHRLDAQNHAEFNLTSRSGAPMMLTMDEGRMTSQKQRVQISGRFDNHAFSTESAVTAKEIRIVSPEGNITLPEINLKGAMGLSFSETGGPSEATAQIEAPDIRAEFGSTAVRLSKATFAISAKGRPGQPWHFDARLKLLNGRASDSAQALHIKRLFVDLPLNWPQINEARRGRLSAGSIKWRDQSLGGVEGTLRQKNQGLAMDLHHNSKLFPGMRVLINGGIDRRGAVALDAKVPGYQLAEAIDLGRFQPAAAGLMASGQVEAAAGVRFDNGRLDGEARFQFKQGRLHQPGRNLLLEGVDMTLQIDQIRPIQSAPQQTLKVDRLVFGNLAARNLKVDYQLEHPGVLFVEKAQIEWSEGKINTAALRIDPEVDVYDIILFCDRLNLAMVLEQLADAQADGEGTVSGRVPIRWDHGRLSFDNGFLYSSPGQTGAIQIAGTEVLLSGLPPGTPQYAQLDIATEALKDYTYKWAKLTVETEDDILLLKLQFDGKPNRLLPFAYDQQAGQFKRVAGEGQADFKGISIDLNLRSPLNEIMNYKELLK